MRIARVQIVVASFLLQDARLSVWSPEPTRTSWRSAQPTPPESCRSHGSTACSVVTPTRRWRLL